MRDDPMTIGLFINNTGHHVASWRHPDAAADANINLDHYIEITKLAESAKFEFIFVADSMATRSAPIEALSRSAQYTAYFEPLTLMAALGAVTTHIGLISTATTSFYEPYHLARLFASIDHISHGRAGWNIVTSSMGAEAQNFGIDSLPPKAERYVRAHEFVDVVKGLWDSWDDDAFIRDKPSGVYFKPEGMHRLDHVGKRFAVRGPLNVPRPPQGHPVLVQAGTSADGRDFAAAVAEVVFTSELTLEASAAYSVDVRARMDRFGRDSSRLRVLPGISVVVGRTDEEAHEKNESLQRLIDPVVGREILSTVLGGFDLSGYDMDKPLPELPETEGLTMGTARNVIEMGRRENLTIREMYLRVAGGRGKMVLVGSPKTIADEMERWYQANAVDGFIIQPPHLPGSLYDFVELMVPELTRRGLMRTEYAGPTLRENLGLPRPLSRYLA
jgi:FMN-dependent oxidoreductase (nitrilotriacetate monooxygenase family)